MKNYIFVISLICLVVFGFILLNNEENKQEGATQTIPQEVKDITREIRNLEKDLRAQNIMGESVPNDYISKVSGDIYDKKGDLDENHIFDDEYFKVPSEYVNSNLKGEFLVDSKSRVYYIEN